MISQDYSESLIKKPLSVALQLITVIVIIFFSLRTQYETFSTSGFGFDPIYLSPVKEAEYIQSNFSSLRMGNDYYCGSYLLWSLWPSLKVFIDARYFPYSKWYNEYDEFEINKDTAGRDIFIDKYDIGFWCISHGSPLIQYFISSPDWKLVYYGQSACIFLSKYINFSEGHKISPLIYNVGFYRALSLAHFAFAAGDITVAKNLTTSLKPFPLSKKQKQTAFNQMVSLGDTLISRQYLNEAVEIYTSALNIYPQNVDVKNRLTAVQDKMKTIEANISNLQKELKTNPSNYSCMKVLSVLYAKKGDYQKAIDGFKQLIGQETDQDPDIFYNIACQYAKMNRVDESVRWLDRAVKNGFKDWFLLKQDSDLMNIHQTDFYKQLIRKM